MSRYLTPLPGLLATAIDRAINHATAADPSGRQRLRALDQRRIKLVLTGLGIDLAFHGEGDRLTVVAETDQSPDTIISGSPGALMAMAAPNWFGKQSGVRIDGDAGAAQALEQLLRKLDPDWEGVLTEQLGDVLGHQVWRLLSDSLGGSRRVAGVAGEQLAHYLREESGLLTTRAELESFGRDVDELREAADRLESRLRRSGLA
jgi:ubiquinone biosynthesis protein UbiJ